MIFDWWFRILPSFVNEGVVDLVHTEKFWQSDCYKTLLLKIFILLLIQIFIFTLNWVKIYNTGRDNFDNVNLCQCIKMEVVDSV